MSALYIVILNEVKNLLSGNTLSTLSLVGFEEMLRVAQHDKTWRGDASTSLSMTEYGVNEIATAWNKPRNDGVQH